MLWCGVERREEGAGLWEMKVQWWDGWLRQGFATAAKKAGWVAPKDWDGLALKGWGRRRDTSAFK